MIAQYVAFFILALVTLVAAWKMVTTRLITHAALYMALSFTSVSGVFLMLQQEFVAALQILVYGGAITTMVIFAIMLSEIRDVKVAAGGGLAGWLRGSTVFLFVVGAIFAALMVMLYTTANLPQAAAISDVYRIEQIGEQLFTRFVIPFEVASILLLIAMVGAIILTAKEAE